MTTPATSCDVARCFTQWGPRSAIVFDLDDTLYSERDFAFSGFAAVDRFLHDTYGVHVYEDLVKAYREGMRSDIFRQCLGARFPDLNEALLRQVVHMYWTHDPRISLHADATVALSFLAAQNFKIGVVTTGNGAIQRRKSARLRVHEYTHAIVHDDDLLGPHLPGQPGADAFMLLALNLDVEVRDLLFVGDNPLTDFVVPRRLGVPTIRIRRRDGEHRAAEPAGPDSAPDCTIDSMEELTLCFAPSPRLTGRP